MKKHSTRTTQQTQNYKPNPKQTSKNNRPENICTQNFNNNNNQKKLQRTIKQN